MSCIALAMRTLLIIINPSSKQAFSTEINEATWILCAPCVPALKREKHNQFSKRIFAVASYTVLTAKLLMWTVVLLCFVLLLLLRQTDNHFNSNVSLPNRCEPWEGGEPRRCRKQRPSRRSEGPPQRPRQTTCFTWLKRKTLFRKEGLLLWRPFPSC